MRPEDSDVQFVAVDFDGTLFESVWPDPGIGDPIHGNFAKLDAVVAAGWTPVVYTARSWTDYDAIRHALAGMGYPGIRVVCGKLLAVKYIDDRALVAEDASWLP
jgi:hypothetical protein